ncbi:MAG: SAM-dependent chlorinase/fluorinase [Ilumatobacteraceae bacterium]
MTLLTDYGLVDEFVGVMKSVVRDLAPHVAIVDLTHGIAAYDVRGGAVPRSLRRLPARRCRRRGRRSRRGHRPRAIAVEVADGAGVFVGPDNGLLAPAVALLGGAQRAVSLTNPDYRLDGDGGPTFDGRDVFAPAAAHLCNGVDLLDLGDEVDSSTLLPAAVPLPELTDGRLRGQVLWVDGFGNCQLNIGPDELDQIASGEDVVRAARRRWRVAHRAAGHELRRAEPGSDRHRDRLVRDARPRARPTLGRRRAGAGRRRRRDARRNRRR